MSLALWFQELQADVICAVGDPPALGGAGANGCGRGAGRERRGRCEPARGDGGPRGRSAGAGPCFRAEVEPSPGTHAILTLLEAGESVL